MGKPLWFTITYTLIGLIGGWKLLSIILDYLYKPSLTGLDALVLIAVFALSVVSIHIGLAGALSTVLLLRGRR
ncbi:MAG: hypothetical protein QW604_02510 [Fervidicoccaceae archaeon]|jgi:hypothetical protein